MKTWFRNLSLFGSLVLCAVSGVVLLALGAVALLMTLPDVGTLDGCLTTSMYEVELCPKSANYVKLRDISPYVIHAVIASEDGAFYEHKGFDWHEMKESMTANLSSGGFRRGGSTLTQQLAKNVYLGKEKAISRKLKEAYLASAIERRYDKNFILEKYLNVVEFGPDMYGVKAAAQYYFHKAPAALHPLEAAYLAFLLPNPKGYSKSFRQHALTKFGTKQIKVILNRMKSYGKLTPEAYATAVDAVGAFPWSDMSVASFNGTPSYSLETNVKQPPTDAAGEDDPVGEVLREDEEINSGKKSDDL